MKDNSLRIKVEQYLSAKEADRDVVDGAKLLFAIDRNRYFLNNAIRNSRSKTIRNILQRKLEKYLGVKIETPVAADGEQETPEENKDKDAVPIAKGKRLDHDSLPANIQACYIENLTLLQEIRSLHEKLKLLANDPSSDLEPDASRLIALDKQRLENWELYDNYKLETAKDNDPEKANDVDHGVPSNDGQGQNPADANKVIQSARTFISRNIEKLCELKSDDTQLRKYTELLERVQQRYTEASSLGATFADETKENLKNLGVKV